MATPLPEFFRERTAAGGEQAYLKARIAREHIGRAVPADMFSAYVVAMAAPQSASFFGARGRPISGDKMTRIVRALAFASMAMFASIAIAQESYPNRPVRLIVPSSPGGGTDTSGRIIALKLTEALGQQVVVENRAGAAAMIGAEAVAKAAPDGYTLLIHNSTLSIYPAVNRKIRVDPVRDLAPLSLVLVLPQILVSHPSLPTQNLKELIAFMQGRPGKLDYAGGGVGGNPHMSMELFLSMTRLKATYVPYKSGNAGLVDVLSGQVPLLMGSMLSAMPHVRQGRLRAYGVSGLKRTSGAPDIPTIAEAGVPGYEALQWFGLFAPAGTPKEIVQRLHAEIVRAAQDAEIRKRFVNDGGDPQASRTPEEFADYIRADMAKWAKVVRDAGIKPVQ